MSTKAKPIAYIRRDDGTLRPMITTPGFRATPMDTQWGRVTHLAWCWLEANRINQCGGQAIVAELPNGEVCICKP